MINAERLYHALTFLVSNDTTVFIWGPDPENPIADVPIASREFARLLAEQYEDDEQ